MRRTTHLSDDRLVEVCLDGGPSPAEAAHVSGCGECAGRRQRLERMLTEITAAADRETDEAFPEDKLATQRQRILQRIEQDGRPARVIAFPAAQAPELRPLRTRPAARWIAAAAAAGLAVGLLAGHLAHDLEPTNATRTASARLTAPRPAAQPAFRAVNASLTDEELLGEIELALDGPTLAVLRPLNELTPY